MTTEFLTAALAYAARGWPVFPCETGGKEPYPTGGTRPDGTPYRIQWGKYATRDEAQIRKLWGQWPTANIAIVTGEKSGVDVLDIDADSGGAESLAELERKYGELPATVESLTGGGGRHLLFAHNGHPFGNDSKGKLGPGIHVRTSGGYIIAPPSIHPNGRAYEWDVTRHPDDMPLAELPEWVVKALVAPQAVQMSALNSNGERIPKGSRNQTLTSLAGKIRRPGMTQDAIEAALLAENAARCDPPLPDSEVRAIAQSVARYEPSRPEPETPPAVVIDAKRVKRIAPKPSSKGKHPAGAELPPHDVDAELAVLGALLLDAEIALPQVTPILKPSDFYIVKHGWIYAAALALRDRGEPVDPVTLPAELEKRGRLAEIGGPEFVAGLEKYVPTAYHAGGYAKIVREKAERREWLNLASEIAQDAYADDFNALDLNERTKITLDALRRNGYQREAATWGGLDRMIAPIEWTWRNWLPAGMLVLFAAMPGEGKSAVMVRLAGCFIRRDNLPDGSPYTGETGKVLWIETEAAEALNLSRAKAWGLPLDSILTPFDDPLREANLDDSDHRAAVLTVAQRPDVCAIFVDSLSGSSRLDENSSEMLELALWLAGLARDTTKPVLVSHHLRKRGLFDGDEVSLDRVRGSTTILQPARVVWALDAPNPAHREVKCLHVIKSNLSKFPDPIGLTIDDAGVTFCPAPEAPKEETQSERLADLLLDLLANGPVPAEQIQKEVEQAGLSWHGAKRAKAKLGIVSVKPGGIWHWSLPANG